MGFLKILKLFLKLGNKCWEIMETKWFRDNLIKFNFYVDKVIENNWSRAVLLNFLDTDLFERQGNAITNFKYTLPKESGDLAQEITKDPYNFDFVAIRQGYDEKELKDALMDNVQNF